MKANFEENLAEEQRKSATIHRVSLSVKESYQEAEQALEKCRKRMQIIDEEEKFTIDDIKSAKERKSKLEWEIVELNNKYKIGVPYAEVYKGL